MSDEVLMNISIGLTVITMVLGIWIFYLKQKKLSH